MTKRIQVTAVKVKKERKQKDPTPPFLPPQFSSVTLVAPRRSGKTNLICWMLLNGLLDSYERVVLYSPSIYFDQTYKSIMSADNLYFSDEISDEELQQVMKEQSQLAMENKKNTLLIIIDDFSSQLRGKAKFGGFQKTLDTLYSRCRHILTTVICTSQYYSHLSPCVRMNTSHLICFRLSRKEWKRVAEEFRLHLSEKEFISMAEAATKEKYSFFLVDMNTPDDDKVFGKGFRK